MVSHLYVHVPFCGRRCVYCDFSIAVRRVTPVDRFVEAIKAELDGLQRENVFAADNGAEWTLDTVYFGGGTPSRLGEAGIAALLDVIRRRAIIAGDAEVTIEANPEDVSLASVRGWRAAGVNRVSLGAQSFDDKVLAWMHRNHTAADIERSTDILRAEGISNFSIDLIFALPASLQRRWSADLDKAISLDAPHLSVYGLTVEPATPLARSINRGAIAPGGDTSYAEEFLDADSRLSAAGYAHYEVSNYARAGFQSRHNSAYWTGAGYLGIGPSAHSFLGNNRSWNVRGYEEWRDRVTTGRTVVEGFEPLSSEARKIERAYLGLRTSAGIVASNGELDQARAWANAGWATLDGSTLRLTPEGWLRLDSLVASLGGTPASDNYITGYGITAA